MKDRVSTFPGRVRLVPVPGQKNVYDRTWADEPTQEGTPINKKAFLPDDLAAYLELEQADPTVADALRKLQDRLLRTSEVYTGDTEPTASTRGKVGDVYMQRTGTNAYKLWWCTDIVDGTYVWIALLNMGYTMVTKTFTATQQYTLPSGLDTERGVRIIAVGGGGGGGNGNKNGVYYGGGGGSGYMRTFNGAVAPGTYTVTVGAGGAAGSAGGASSFGTVVTAPGGGAGTGANGGSGMAGGGGSGGSGFGGDGGNGETGGGGGGASETYTQPTPGKGGNGGTYGGGGGGGAGETDYEYGAVTPAAGGNSAAYAGAEGTAYSMGASFPGEYSHGGGGAGYAANASGTTGGKGTNTTSMGLEYTGAGNAGTGEATGRMIGGGGGGGYGGNGGTSYTGAGAGGGGYGAAGGDATAGSTNVGSGGGGGGYGHAGRPGTGGNGGGGGGYSPAGIGAGGSGTEAGSNGVVILTYYTFYAGVVS